MSLDTRPGGSSDTPIVTEQRVTVEGETVVTTPGLRRLGRRASFWVALVVALFLLAFATIAIGGTGASGPTLLGTGTASNGARALLQVLRSDGVAVKTPRTLEKALNDGSDGGTFAIYDEHSLLTRDQVAQLHGIPGTIVLIDPSFQMLQELAPDVRLAGPGKKTFPADEAAACGFGPLEKAGAVSAASSTYRVVAGAGGEVQKCLPVGDDAYALVTVTTGDTRVIVFGLPTALTNQNIVTDGNAALGLGTFGHDAHLTWYLPSEEDVTLSAADTPVPLPGWVLPTELLAVIVVVAAAIWRGRRFGPLVIERMPVVVRASETMEGRARLYQRASSREHALDALRIGTIGRLATLCGLPALATVDEIIGAVAVVTATDPNGIRSLLVDEVPANDARLVALSRQLDELETAVGRATRPT